MLQQSHGHYEFQRCIATRAAWTNADRKWCSFSIESAIRTQTRLHHLIDTSKVGRRPTWKRSSMRPPRAIGSLIRSWEVSMAGHCTNTSISLQDRLSCKGAISRRELAFFLQGPMKLRSHKELQFWRDAPRIGLTGVAEIEIGERGVVAERVAYDLNLASDMLCRTDRSRIGRRNGRSGHASGSG